MFWDWEVFHLTILQYKNYYFVVQISKNAIFMTNQSTSNKLARKKMVGAFLKFKKVK
jgi:hypothetical protein